MENSHIQALTDLQECSDAVVKLIESAQYHVAMFTQKLEPQLFNHRELCEHLLVLARRHRSASVRIIAKETRSAASDGHCLVHLAQNLSSYVSIRSPQTPELQTFSQSWLIVDNHSICEITNPERYEGKLIENDRLHVRNQLEFFDHAWENSEPDIHTRRLHI